MRLCLPLFLAAILAVAPAARAEELDCVTTEWKLLGANHKVCVYGLRRSRTSPASPAT